MRRVPTIQIKLSHNLGREAFLAGDDMSLNPWPLMSRQNAGWDDGWLEGLDRDMPVAAKKLSG